MQYFRCWTLIDYGMQAFRTLSPLMRASLVYGINSNGQQHEFPIDSTSVSKELPLNLDPETVLHCSKTYFLC
jgi:hypothetical protein